MKKIYKISAYIFGIIAMILNLQSCSYDTEDVYLPAHENGIVNFTVTNLTLGECVITKGYEDEISIGYIKAQSSRGVSDYYTSDNYSFRKEVKAIVGRASEDDVANNPDNCEEVNGEWWLTENREIRESTIPGNAIIAFPGSMLRIEYFPQEGEEYAEFTLPGGTVVRLTKENSTYDFLYSEEGDYIAAVSSYEIKNSTYDLKGIVSFRGLDSYSSYDLTYKLGCWWTLTAFNEYRERHMALEFKVENISFGKVPWQENGEIIDELYITGYSIGNGRYSLEVKDNVIYRRATEEDQVKNPDKLVEIDEEWWYTADETIYSGQLERNFVFLLKGCLMRIEYTPIDEVKSVDFTLPNGSSVTLTNDSPSYEFIYDYNWGYISNPSVTANASYERDGILYDLYGQVRFEVYDWHSYYFSDGHIWWYEAFESRHSDTTRSEKNGLLGLRSKVDAKIMFN